MARIPSAIGPRLNFSIKPSVTAWWHSRQSGGRWPAASNVQWRCLESVARRPSTLNINPRRPAGSWPGERTFCRTNHAPTTRRTRNPAPPRESRGSVGPARWAPAPPLSRSWSGGLSSTLAFVPHPQLHPPSGSRVMPETSSPTGWRGAARLDQSSARVET